MLVKTILELAERLSYKIIKEIYNILHIIKEITIQIQPPQVVHKIQESVT